MPVDIALHPIGTPVHGNHPDAASPVVPVIAQQTGLAEATNSNALAVPKLGGRLVLVATVKLRVDIRLAANAGALDPANSGVVLGANERCTFTLSEGSYILKTAVYA